MKKLLLASVLAIVSFPGYAADKSAADADGEYFDSCVDAPNPADCYPKPTKPPARVTVTPPGPPPIGWVYGPYTQCANPPQCSMGVVNVYADGLNVRVAPNGLPIMALVNGVPLI